MKKPVCPECGSTNAYKTGYSKVDERQRTSPDIHYKCGGCGEHFFAPSRK